jgi:hypothetical protein
MENRKTIEQEARKLVFQIGCAGALKTTLNKSFGNPMKTEEWATAPLCGGIMTEGHQCGMLWGAVLAAGVEAGKKGASESESLLMAIQAAKQLNSSFIKRAKYVNCREITRCNQRSVLGMIKYFITGKPLNCAKLTGRWAPEAIEAANAGLVKNGMDSNENIVSCASLVAKKMGASEKEAIMVAGFAGGIGLSGNTCGALGAAVYLKALDWQRKKPGDTTFKIPESKKTLDAFLKATGGETRCSSLCGRVFESAQAHTDYINNGGCEKIISVLAKA